MQDKNKTQSGSSRNISPIIEVYEYKIHNAPQDPYQKYSLKPVRARMGSISAQVGGARVCCQDVLDDSDSESIRADPEEFNLSRDTPTIELIRYLYTLYTLYQVRQRNNFTDFWKRKINVDYLMDLVNEAKNNLFKCPKDNTYILNIDVDRRAKVIVIGDIHGSYHSFFRILLRLARFNLLDLENLILQRNVYLIFLGDVVDRGFYSLEILLVILTLQKHNPTRVFYNRGNHEEKDINKTNGFYDELIVKICDNPDHTTDADRLFKTINSFYLNCSSAIIVTCENQKRIYLAHGGFSKFHDYTTLDFQNRNVYLLKCGKKVKNSSDLSGVLTRWSDFVIDDSCVNRGFDSRTCLTPSDLFRFLRQTNIDFIIRAHQDNQACSTVFSNTITRSPYYTSACHILAHEVSGSSRGIIYNTNVNSSNEKKGCLCRIVVKHFGQDELPFSDKVIFPVLTTSTNTDFMRNLDGDSFCIIRFDIQNYNDFTTSFGFSANNLEDIHFLY